MKDFSFFILLYHYIKAPTIEEDANFVPMGFFAY